MLSYILHFCCIELHLSKEPKQIFKHYKIIDMFTENNEMTLQAIQCLSKLHHPDDISISMDNDVYALIAARSVFINQEDNTNYLNILEKVMAYEKENPSLLLFDW